MDDIAYRYDETKNPNHTWLDGVPLRDLTQAEFDALRPGWQAAVIREPYYVAVKKTTKGDKTTKGE